MTNVMRNCFLAGLSVRGITKEKYNCFALYSMEQRQTLPYSGDVQWRIQEGGGVGMHSPNRPISTMFLMNKIFP